jgi:multiple sugar transport system permease protein
MPVEGARSSTSPTLWRSAVGFWQRRSVRNALMSWFGILISGLGALMILVPFFWMLSTSLKEPDQIAAFPPVWIPNPFDFKNYVEAVTLLPFAQFALNTIVITTFAVVGAVLTGSICAFAFSRLQWPGRNIIFFLILTELFLPGPVTLIPKFILFRQLGWIDTFLPLTVPWYFGGGPFTIFLLRQFFMTIPPDLDDAARIDGCNIFDIYWRIVLPLARPALGIATIFAFQHNWNDFLSPLIYLSRREHYTLAIGLRMFQDEYNTNWDWLMAASLIVMLPLIIMFFVAQRYYVQGIVFTGVKG